MLAPSPKYLPNNLPCQSFYSNSPSTKSPGLGHHLEPNSIISYHMPNTLNSFKFKNVSLWCYLGLFIYQRGWRMMPSPAAGWQQLETWSFWHNTSHVDAGSAGSSLLGLGHWLFWAWALFWFGGSVNCYWVWPRQLLRGECGTTCLYASSCLSLDHL